MFRDRELNPIMEKNNWDELTYEEQKEVLRGFTIKYSAISKGTFDPIYLTVEEKEYEVKYNPIAEWFYLGISNAKIHDFFNAQGSSYNRNWSEDAFDYNWKPENQE